MLRRKKILYTTTNYNWNDILKIYELECKLKYQGFIAPGV